MKVFLGGTCNDSTWRDQLIPNLHIDYFNPVVPDWTEECYKRELVERETCEIVLYTITPLMTGVYSIAEVVDDSNKRPGKTVLCIKLEDNGKVFDVGQKKSIGKVAQMVSKNGGIVSPFEALADLLNDYENARSNIKLWIDKWRNEHNLGDNK